VSTVHSTFIYEFSIGTHELGIAPKPCDGITEVGKIPADETGVPYILRALIKKFINLEEETRIKKNCLENTNRCDKYRQVWGGD
jgi:hypothetical protein